MYQTGKCNNHRFCSLSVRYCYSHRKAVWFSCPDLVAFTKTMHMCFQIPNTHRTSGWHSVNWVATDTMIQSPEMLNPKTLSAVQKWLNRSTCHLVSGLGWAEWSNSDAAMCQITLTSRYRSCCWSLAISFFSTKVWIYRFFMLQHCQHSPLLTETKHFMSKFPLSLCCTWSTLQQQRLAYIGVRQPA